MRIVSADFREWSDAFPGVALALRKLAAHDVVVEGFLCALDERARPCFELLRERARTRASALFAVWDVLHLDGEDLRGRTFAHARGTSTLRARSTTCGECSRKSPAPCESLSMAVNERRRHVRLKPTPDLPVRVALAGDGLLREALDVIDLSVGGLALSSPALANTKLGERLRLHLTLGTSAEHIVDVVTRWKSPDGAGVELVDPPPRAAQELGRYIAELLERGQS